jgi:hypothetical protein
MRRYLRAFLSLCLVWPDGACSRVPPAGSSDCPPTDSLKYEVRSPANLHIRDSDPLSGYRFVTYVIDSVVVARNVRRSSAIQDVNLNRVFAGLTPDSIVSANIVLGARASPFSLCVDVPVIVIMTSRQRTPHGASKGGPDH